MHKFSNLGGRLRHYILADDGKTPIPTDDIMEWGKFFNEPSKRIVRKDYFGEVMISTVFLGMDHGWNEDKPVLWETMIFGGPHDEWQNRATSYEEALKCHDEAIALVKGAAHA